MNPVILGIGIVFASMGSAMASPPVHMQGNVYKHLKYVRESGDLIGMAVKIGGGTNPKITVTSCEGGCFGGKDWPLLIKGSTISFTICDDLKDRNGTPSPCNPIRYVGHFRPDGALVLLARNQSGSRLVLRRVRHPKPMEVEKLGCAVGNC